MARVFTAALILAGLLYAQPDRAFEAASIKPRPNPQGAVHFTVLPNRLDVQNMSLAFLIQQAFDLPPFEVSIPDSAAVRHYDIAATSGAQASPAEMRTMLRNLLIQRFHMATHWDERMVSLFRLTVVPTGHKMKSADQGYAIANSPMRGPNSMQLTGPMSMHQLAERLTQAAGKPVLDTTGLEGYFRISLAFEPYDLTPTSDNGLAAPLLPAALQDQLGLRLVSAKDQIRVLVVDHVDPVPTEN